MAKITELNVREIAEKMPRAFIFEFLRLFDSVIGTVYVYLASGAGHDTARKKVPSELCHEDTHTEILVE